METMEVNACTHYTDLESSDGNNGQSREILNMFNTGSRPTITKSVVESANFGIGSCGYGLLVKGHLPFLVDSQYKKGSIKLRSGGKKRE